MSDSYSRYKTNRYRIMLKESLDDSWSNWFGEMALSVETNSEGEPVTILSGPVVDQAALRGLLNRMWDLNLTILSVERAFQNE